MQKKINWQEALEIYFIAGTQDVSPGQLLPILDEALRGGITAFQLREKGTNALKSSTAIKQLGVECQQRCQKAGIPFIVNDDVALAIEIGADAVHVGQRDQNIKETIRATKPLGMGVGLSINTLAQLKEALTMQELAYIGLGPVYPTQSKADPQPVVGLSLLKTAVELGPQLPKVAIGGINLANVEEIKETGVDGVAVISVLATNSKMAETIRLLGGTNGK